MYREYGIREEDVGYIESIFEFAKRIGCIKDTSWAGLEERRIQKNKDNLQKKQAGEILYGLEEYSKIAYLGYELASFRLDFVSMAPYICKKYEYRHITREMIETYYKNNPQLFVRAEGNSFALEEVEEIIHKRLRQEEYEENVKNILCQSK